MTAQFNVLSASRMRDGMHGGHFRASWSLLLLLLSFGLQSRGQGNALVTVDRNPVIAGEAFRITFEFRDAKVPFENPPNIDGVRYLNGPSSSTSTQITNGQVTSKRGYTYTAVAAKPGLIRIPSFNFNSNKGRLQTEPINLRVASKGSGNNRQPAQFEAVIEVDKKKAHLGEAVRVQYRIYNRLDAVDVRNYTFPELAGAWKETVEGEDPRWETTILDGKRVQVATVRTDILYPTRTGPLEIEGFDVEAQMRISFFNTRPIASSARPVSIEVLPLPTTGAEGALGTFQQLTMTWKAQNNASPKTNEAVNVILEFKGKGNLPLIGAPEINWPEDLEVFDPDIEDRVTTDLQGQRGRRTFTYLVIPRSEGRYEISLPAMSYFDHALDRFLRLDAPAIALDVTGQAGEEGPSFGFNSKTDVTILTRDMRFIRTETELKPRSRPFFGGPIHMGLWGLPPLMLICGALAMRRKERESKDPVLARRRAARTKLNAVLKQARLGGGSLDALGQSAQEFLQAQLDIPRSEASMERYGEALQASAPNIATEWLDVIETLDRGRFAPGAPAPADMAMRLERAAKSLEQSKGQRKKRTPGNNVLVAMLVLASGTVWSAPDTEAAQAEFYAGNSAYLEGDFEAAIRHYETVAKAWTSFELEYNLGVAHYKSGRIGPSILHFERARRIRPSDDDLQANLLLARAAVVDRIEPMPEIALGPLWRELTAEHRLPGWTWSSLALWLLAFVSYFLRMRSDELATRRTLTIVAPTLALLALMLGFMSRSTFQRSKSDDGAVIMSPRVEVMSSPAGQGDASKLFVLHEGTVVEVLRTEGDWLQIKLVNGNAGWVPSPSIAAI